MKFTAAQVALFNAGISFVHMAPNEKKSRIAREDLVAALAEKGPEFAATTSGEISRGNYRDPDFVYAHFIVCAFAGSSTEHVPVMFVDGIDAEFYDQIALFEAAMIPAAVKGVGPMVIR